MLFRLETYDCPNEGIKYRARHIGTDIVIDDCPTRQEPKRVLFALAWDGKYLSPSGTWLIQDVHPHPVHLFSELAYDYTVIAHYVVVCPD